MFAKPIVAIFALWLAIWSYWPFAIYSRFYNKLPLNISLPTSLICPLCYISISCKQKLYLFESPPPPPMYWNGLYRAILRKVVAKKVQSWKVIWDMMNTLFLTLFLTLYLLVSFSTRKHKSVASCVILSNFFEEQWTQNHQQYGILACTFSENLSQNNYIPVHIFIIKL